MKIKDLKLMGMWVWEGGGGGCAFSIKRELKRDKSENVLVS